MVQPELERKGDCEAVTLRHDAGADTLPVYAREKVNHCDKSMSVSQVHLLVAVMKEDFALLQSNAICGAFAAVLYCPSTLKPGVHLVLLLFMKSRVSAVFIQVLR